MKEAEFTLPELAKRKGGHPWQWLLDDIEDREHWLEEDGEELLEDIPWIEAGAA